MARIKLVYGAVVASHGARTWSSFKCNGSASTASEVRARRSRPPRSPELIRGWPRNALAPGPST